MTSVQFNPTDSKAITDLRFEYLKQLPAFQEFFLELLVQKGLYYEILLSGSRAGYLVKTAEGILIEFHLDPSYFPLRMEIFKQLIPTLGVHKVYCKSFDALLLNCCLAQSYEYEVFGWMFRECNLKTEFNSFDGKIRWAQEKDLPFLLAQQGDLYDTPEELRYLLTHKEVVMYFNSSDQLLGCGFLSQIHTDFGYMDIGMWVHPAFRRQGMGTAIISHLKEVCSQRRFIPVCGCAAKNRASKKTLEKNGFITRHILWEFQTIVPQILRCKDIAHFLEDRKELSGPVNRN